MLGRRPHFATRDVRIGRHVRFGRNVRFHCRKVRIGDGVVFQDNVVVNADVFEIGDYGTIYEGCFFPGPGELRIGHNFWLGIRSIVDAQGGTRIGNNVCVGPHSQLWTHMVFGDTLQGCRFHAKRPLTIGDDAWLCHCLVSPVTIGARCLVMLGSLVTKDLEPGRTYAGAPAKDVTDTLGPQFAERSVEEKAADLRARLEAFGHGEFFRVVTAASDIDPGRSDITWFNVADRTYTKRGTKVEHRCMRFLLPEAKFLPA